MNSRSPLIIHTECSDGWGGQEIRIMEEMRGMRKHGISTSLIAPEHSHIFRKAGEEGFSVYPVTFSSKFHLPSWILLFRYFKQLRPDVVNTHSSDDTWIAGCIARLLGVPLIIRTRHVSTPIGSTFSYRYFPHVILTTSEVIRKHLIDKGLHGSKIFPVPTGIDLERFKFSADHRNRVRKRLGLSNHHILVGNICVLRSWKGLDFFIDTAATLPDPFRFILVGDGPRRHWLHEKAKSLEMENRLIFAGHQDQVEQYFSAIDIFFFTSYASEGIPQSLLQAMSIGLPLVVCRTPSVIETLQGIDNFMAIDYGDTEGSQKALIQISDRLAHFNEGSDNRKQILSRFGIENMWDALISLYREHGVI